MLTAINKTLKEIRLALSGFSRMALDLQLLRDASLNWGDTMTPRVRISNSPGVSVSGSVTATGCTNNYGTTLFTCASSKIFTPTQIPINQSPSDIYFSDLVQRCS